MPCQGLLTWPYMQGGYMPCQHGLLTWPSVQSGPICENTGTICRLSRHPRITILHDIARYCRLSRHPRITEARHQRCCRSSNHSRHPCIACGNSRHLCGHSRHLPGTCVPLHAPYICLMLQCPTPVTAAMHLHALIQGHLHQPYKPRMALRHCHRQSTLPQPTLLRHHRVEIAFPPPCAWFKSLNCPSPS